MTDSPAPLPSACDVVVVGASLSGLVAAFELARTGLSVLVLEADGLNEVGRLGTQPTSALPAQARADRIASVVRDPGDELRTLLADLESSDAAYSLSPLPIAVSDASAGVRLLDYDGILGIPVSPLGRDVAKLVGTGPSLRGYLDRLKPVLTIGKEQYLGPLVRSRLGATLACQLVEPVVRDRYGVDADQVEVAVAIPGLNEAMTRTGSLSGAVLSLVEEHRRREVLHGVTGGLGTLVRLLQNRLDFFSAPVATGQRVTSVVEQASSLTAQRLWSVNTADGRSVTARSVLLACSPSNVDVQPTDLHTWQKVADSRDEIIALRERADGGSYAISVIRCATADLAGVAPYTISARPDGGIRRVERLSAFEAAPASPSADGTEALRVVRYIGADGEALQPLVEAELSAFLGLERLSIRETLVDERSPVNWDTPTRAHQVQGEPDEPASVALCSFVRLWPQEGQLDQVLAHTKEHTLRLRRHLLGLA
ncbi:protoporphyrinogen/coproporphyrinogen oxidase [Lysinibacter cavernae]|uniref:Amine oxidase domain-containing protein n=1 Tax=Lysinibacter cavernae TaxID=1640652 RepID=A0A7X5TTR4_9MICO|nr:FAD-dependent oxidoreductase [Lysinibacter cavernae]NIH54891.1 hypothetical protein [Lysinibacter cavernae]